MTASPTKTPRAQRTRLVGLCIFLLSAVVAATLIWNMEQHRRRSERAEALSLVADHAQALQQNIQHALSATYTLAVLIRRSHGVVPDFDTLASELLPYYPGASLLILAPGGIISNVVPRVGNEAAMGLNLLTDPVMQNEALLARDTGKLVLTGPLPLAQGGLGVIGRLPVFLDGTGGKPSFWGFTNVVIRFPQALAIARLPQLELAGFNYVLWRKHPQTGEKQLIGASSSTLLSEPVDALLALPDGNWTLSAAPAQGWGDPGALGFKVLLGLCCSLLLAYVAMLVLRLDSHKGKLVQVVVERTQALALANADLAARESLLKQVLDTSSVAIFLVDLQGRITQANQRMAEMFRYPVEALTGLDYVTLVDPAEHQAARQQMQALLASTVPAVDLDRLYWRADQTQFWGHLSGKRFIDSAGQEHGLIGVIVDITERKRVEEQMRQHDNRLSAIIENFPGGVSMIDTDMRLVAYNQQFKQLLDFPDSLFEKPDLALDDILRFNAQRGEYGPGDVEQQVTVRIERAGKFKPHKFERVRPNGKVLEIQGEVVPGGGFVTFYLDITERKRMEEQVRQLAFYDPLTKLPNRRLLNDRLRQSLVASKRAGCYGALMFLDLDNFKTLNDTHGHGAGDLLLIEAAHRLTHSVREIDTVARLGGDEFVVVLGNLSSDKTESTTQARTIAEKISHGLAEPYLLSIQLPGAVTTQVLHQCTVSIGVVVFIEHEGRQEDFLKWADAAMYQAKEAGSNLIRFWDSPSTAPATGAKPATR